MNTQERILDLLVILKTNKSVTLEFFCTAHNIKGRAFKEYIRLLRFYQSRLFNQFTSIKYCNHMKAYLLVTGQKKNPEMLNSNSFSKTQKRVIEILLQFNEEKFLCVNNALGVYKISSKTLQKIISSLRNIQFALYDHNKIIVYKAKIKRYVLEDF